MRFFQKSNDSGSLGRKQDFTVEAPKLGGLYHWHKSGVHYVITLYKADKFTGELKSYEEGRVYWIPLEELKTKELATGMEHVLRILESEKGG